MSTRGMSLALAIRLVLAFLFLPFSTLAMVLDFRGGVALAQEPVQNQEAETGLILVGLFGEVFLSAGVVSGIADRVCAFVLAGYCGDGSSLETVLAPGRPFELKRHTARVLFWDFWKNLALAAGLLSHRLRGRSIAFPAHPTIQSHPYRLTREHARP
jgi:putative oxidoreductase